ncbi:fibrinogen-like protein 1 [Arapaima gigas]
MLSNKFPLSPVNPLCLLPLLSLCTGASASSDVPTCSRPPCRDSLVALPGRTGGCEGRPAGSGCRVETLSTPVRMDKRREMRQGHPEANDVSERLSQLQRCMGALQEPGGHQGHSRATLALVAAILTQCDLRCHSPTLRSVAKQLGEARLPVPRTCGQTRHGLFSPLHKRAERQTQTRWQ